MNSSVDIVLDLLARCPGAGVAVAVSTEARVPIGGVRTHAQHCRRRKFSSGVNQVPAREGIRCLRVIAHVFARVTDSTKSLPLVSIANRIIR